jgi:hypothetical protein
MGSIFVRFLFSSTLNTKGEGVVALEIVQHVKRNVTMIVHSTGFKFHSLPYLVLLSLKFVDCDFI